MKRLLMSTILALPAILAFGFLEEPSHLSNIGLIIETHEDDETRGDDDNWVDLQEKDGTGAVIENLKHIFNTDHFKTANETFEIRLTRSGPGLPDTMIIEDQTLITTIDLGAADITDDVHNALAPYYQLRNTSFMTQSNDALINYVAAPPSGVSPGMVAMVRVVERLFYLSTGERTRADLDAFLLLFDDVNGYLEDDLRVDSTVDVPDYNPGDMQVNSPGSASLRAAVMEANAHPIPQTIRVPAGTYTLDISGIDEDGCAAGDLDITQDLVIVGNGAASTIIQGDMADRLMQVMAGVTVVLYDLTLESGDAVTGPMTENLSGGAMFNDGTTTLVRVHVSNNTAAFGGAVYNQGTFTSLGSTFYGNQGDQGGALLNDAGGSVFLTNTTFSGNTAQLTGGAVYNKGDLDLTNVTMTANTADNQGGLAAVSGSADVLNTIIAGNIANTYPDVDGTCNSLGGNLIGYADSGSGFVGNIDDQVGSDVAPLDPLLGPLVDNGGGIFSHVMLDNSPAVDAGLSGGAPLVDLRGYVRPQDGDGSGGAAHDVGALETPEQPLMVAHPNGGETFAAGETMDITWNPVGGIANCKIVLSRDNGASWETLVASTANDGLYSWVVNGSAVAGVIDVRDATDPNIYDRSNSPFTIPTAQLELTYPSGGETLLPGADVAIAWNAAHFTGTVSLKLSRDNGATWETIANNLSQVGPYVWNVQGSATTQAVVRIYSDDIGGLKNSSPAFTIAEPVLAITSPNGGETFSVGSVASISWNAAQFAGTVSVKLSRDNGSTWETIANNISSSGPINWTVTGPETNQGIVRIYSDDVLQLKDRSDGVFNITAD